MSMDEGTLIHRAAERLRSREPFMAFRLGNYVLLEKISSQELSMRLGCDEEGLIRMELCLAPGPGASDFISKLEKIAEYGGADVNALIQVVRRVDSIMAMRTAGQRSRRYDDPGLLMAARDGEKDPTENQED